MKNILITGGAGFIGSHLVEKLLFQGNKVSIIDNFNDFYDPLVKEKNIAPFQKEVEVFRTNIEDSEEIKKIFLKIKPDTLIHLAARAGVRPSILNPKSYIETNVLGTLSLLEAAKIAQTENILFASSSSVYGDSPVIPFSEELPLLHSLSPYAASKIAGEQLCANYSSLYQMRMRLLRFFTVYGPRQRPDLAIHQFTRFIDQGIPIKQFGDGSTERDYTFIEDILQGVIASLEDPGPLFDIFNLGENQTTSLSNLIKLIENSLEKKAIIDYYPLQKGDMIKTCANITKAKERLGYLPTTPIEKGIPLFIDWYLREKKEA